MIDGSTMTFGCDVGDKYTHICGKDADGDIVVQTRIRTDPKRMGAFFGKYPGARVALEAGAHSRWISEQMKSLDLDVIVANARRLKLIFEADYKTDRKDAECLADLARFDPKFLRPIEHRGKGAQLVVGMMRCREQLVRARTQMVNCARGIAKSHGERLPGCSAPAFASRARESLSGELLGVVTELLDSIEQLTKRIRRYDAKLEDAAAQKFPETEVLRQVNGVGPLTALGFVVTLEDPRRFEKSRQVGSYLGLCPRKDQSGDVDKQLPITKAGDIYVRKLLVQAAHYTLGPFGQDSDLRRWGLKLAERGGSNAKRRAVVAVARKLAVLLHRLWVTGEEYVPVGYGRHDNKAA